MGKAFWYLGGTHLGTWGTHSPPPFFHDHIVGTGNDFPARVTQSERAAGNRSPVSVSSQRRVTA
jgi:hypothetical protein